MHIRTTFRFMAPWLASLALGCGATATDGDKSQSTVSTPQTASQASSQTGARTASQPPVTNGDAPAGRPGTTPVTTPTPVPSPAPSGSAAARDPDASQAAMPPTGTPALGSPNDEGTDKPSTDSRSRPTSSRLLGELVPSDVQQASEATRRRTPRTPVDPRRAEQAGVRRLESTHLILFTDVPEQPALEDLPRVFDLAMPQWCDYFQVDPQQTRDWKLTAYIMRDRDRFRAIGALPAELPEFEHGFQLDDELWVVEQKTDYYRRHLLLHEGTHAFMNRWLGGIGPPWYGEGMAELLATHRWVDGQLTLRYLPRSSDEVPGLGRVKIVRDDFAAGNARSLELIFQYDLRAHLKVNPYGWCWAAAIFLDSHPRTREAFRAAQANARDGGLEFTRSMLQPLLADWPHISEDWQLFISQAEYGYDVERAAVRHKPSQPLTEPEVRLKIASDAGWQSTGVQLEAGVTYEIAAVGRFQLVGGEPIWWSEPGGVTIKYYRGHPLGMLLGAVRPDSFVPTSLTPLAHATPIGRKHLLTPESTGTLYLKINEPPLDLADNAGEILVRVRRFAE